jgi:hypothetical protein
VIRRLPRPAPDDDRLGQLGDDVGRGSQRLVGSVVECHKVVRKLILEITAAGRCS